MPAHAHDHCEDVSEGAMRCHHTQGREKAHEVGHQHIGMPGAAKFSGEFFQMI